LLQLNFELTAIALQFAARDAELNQLKMLVNQLADKVNAPGDTPLDRIAAVEDRVDEVALHGVRLGTTLGLAAMATHTGVDYSIQPRDFQGGAPEVVDEIEVTRAPRRPRQRHCRHRPSPVCAKQAF
jgi:hypothetical protein